MIYVPASGPTKTNLVIVGEAPGREEERQREPFVGSSGDHLRATLLRHGITPEQVYLTNVCHYRPPNNEIEKFIKLKKGVPQPNELVLSGIMELYRDLARIQPTLIAPLGNTALWALTGQRQISKRRGSIMEVQANLNLLQQLGANKLDEAAAHLEKIVGTKVVPTLHPAAVLRQFELNTIFDFDIGKIAAERKFPELNLPQRTYYIDPPEAQALELAKQLLAAEQISIDIETPGGKLFCVGFSCDPSCALVLKVDKKWKKQLIRMLCENEIPKIFQNGVFDCSFLLKEEGIRVGGYGYDWDGQCIVGYDTMFAQQAAYPEFRVGLDFQASMYTREPYYKDEGKNQDLNIADDELQYLTYNGKDAAVTLEIAQAQQADELTDPNVRIGFETTVMQLPVVIDIMAQGMKLDLLELERLNRWFSDELEKLQGELDEGVVNFAVELASKPKTKEKLAIIAYAKKVAETSGKPKGGLNVFSGPQVKTFFRLFLGESLTSVDEETLKDYYGKTGNELVLKMVRIRKARTMKSRYLCIKHDGNGQTFYSVNPVGTKTARWSTSKTIMGYGHNLQTIPNPTRYQPGMRTAFIAEPGYVLLYPDLSQAEDRIVSYNWNVSAKVHAFENGIDAHALTASFIYDLLIEEILRLHEEAQKEGRDGVERYFGKQSNHAFNYGEGPLRFMRSVNKKADETGIRIELLADAKRIRSKHLAAYPEIEANFWSDIRARLKRDRYLINPFGRKRTFYGRLDDETYRDAYSWIPQSTAPEVINRAMVRIHFELLRRLGGKSRILLQIHDALLIQVPEECWREAWEEIRPMMEIPIELATKEIIIPVDCKIGYSWGGVTKLHKFKPRQTT